MNAGAWLLDGLLLTGGSSGMGGSVTEGATPQIRGPRHHADEHRQGAHTDEGDTDQFSQHFPNLLTAGPRRASPAALRGDDSFMGKKDATPAPGNKPIGR